MMKKGWFQSLSCASRGSRGKNRKRMVSVLDGYLVLFLHSTVRRLDYAKGRPQMPYCFSLLLRRDLSVRPGVAAVGQPARALPLHKQQCTGHARRARGPREPAAKIR